MEWVIDFDWNTQPIPSAAAVVSILGDQLQGYLLLPFPPAGSA